VSEELRLRRALRRIHQHARHEGELVEHRAVVSTGAVVLHGSRDVSEDGARQVLAGGVLEVVEREDVA
jgi:hypothetical protein